MGKRREYRKKSFTEVAGRESKAEKEKSQANEVLQAESTVSGSAETSFAASDGFGGVPPISPEDREIDLSGLDINIEDFLDEDSEYGKIPQPEVFNSYPPEVQRKIMEWTDRDVKARRDDESRRRDEMMRAQIDNKRRRQMFPAIITVLALICAAVTGVVTANPLFPLVFMLVPLAVIAARVAGDDGSGGRGNRRNKPPQV